MNSYMILEYTTILKTLSEMANTPQAKARLEVLEPTLSETELIKNLRDTTQARQMLDTVGTPPIPAMENTEELVAKASRGELLTPAQLEEIAVFLAAVGRLDSYLSRGKEWQIGIAYYQENLVCLEDIRGEIDTCIRGGRVDDYATKELKDIRRNLAKLEETMKQKADGILKNRKTSMSDSFVVTRNGRICLPVRKECKSAVRGSVVDKSSTGATLFIEPEEVAALREEWEWERFAEEEEERRILYTIGAHIAEKEIELGQDIHTIIKLDVIFAKGKLSAAMQACEPSINTKRRIAISQGRHPLLGQESCVPLDFCIEGQKRGMIITGPNTGGKTVAIKTVGLFCLMAASGLHLPCREADICMNSQVLCDIGDGQNLSDNLSTFSAHITNILRILKNVNEESLVILDELGSGTDPAEGMGIAVAILEELEKSGCLFLVTTHYPEVKTYAAHREAVINARMAFDRENVCPLYRLEMGKSGESCALYIARRLGMPDGILSRAAREAYGDEGEGMLAELGVKAGASDGAAVYRGGPRIVRRPEPHKSLVDRDLAAGGFSRGDSVEISPDSLIGIVVRPADDKGLVLVQIKKEKRYISHKRLKLKVAADRLYPEDYDFSIVFDTVPNRKARHKMGKGYQESLEVHTEKEDNWE